MLVLLGICYELTMTLKIAYILFIFLASSGAQQNNITINGEEELEMYLCDNQSLSSNTVFLLRSNITHFIQPGNFCLIEHLLGLSIVGPAVIKCTGPMDNEFQTGLGFKNVSELSIKDVVFDSCGGAVIKESFSFKGVPLIFGPPSLQTVIILNSCWNVTFENVEIVNYRGYAILGINLFGFSMFERLTVHRSHSNNFRLQKILLKSDNFGRAGSGILVYYIDPEYQEKNFTMFNNTTFTSPTPKVDHFVTIQNSVFAYNTNLYPDDLVNMNNLRSFQQDKSSLPLPLSGAGGLSIVNFQMLFNVQIDVLDSSIVNNSGSTSGGVKILHRNTIKHTLIKLQGCSIRNNTILNSLNSGAGLQILLIFSFVRLNQLTQLSNLIQEEYDILIEDTVFSDHFSVDGNTVLISSGAQNISEVMIILRNVSIMGREENGDCIFAQSDRSVYFSNSQLYLFLDQIHIEPTNQFSQKMTTLGAARFVNLAAVFVSGTNENPSVFENGRNGALKAYNTDIHLLGTVVFRNNQGLSGAALFLQENSNLFLSKKLNALFSNNKATENGGAIYIEPVRREQCVVHIGTSTQLFDTNNIIRSQEDLVQINLSVTFVDNEAAIGRSLYGGPLYNCSSLPDAIVQLPRNEIYAIYDTLFIFKQNNKTVSYLDEFRSSAVELCFCEGNFRCVSPPNLEILPGVMFILYVSPVDVIRESVDGVVVAMLPLDSGVRFGTGEVNSYYVFDRGLCEEISYSIAGIENTTIILDLTLQSVFYSSATISTSISILPCPPGFTLSNETGTCDCNELYLLFGVICNITTGQITRPRNEWIGIITKDATELAAIVNTCPYGYCVFDFTTDVNISDPTDICQGGRTGPLCGSCAEGLSIMFGTTDCGECSHYYLLTIFMYALAGILLVLALFIFDITISGGTINGLTVYAQLMGSSLTIVGNSGVQFAKIFISLLNLNLGFPLCFYNGMDKLASTGLQFVFPVYLWLLVAVLTVATNYSSRLQKVFNNNKCLRVLVTLVYLSFAKIIRTITFILLPALVDAEDNNSYVVWFFDGSVQYFSNGWHIFLVLLSLFFTVLTLVYQFTLLLTYFCGLRVGRLNVYLKPIIDLHAAPFKDKWRFWLGFRLIFVEVFTILTLTLSPKFFALSLFLHFVLIFLLTITQIIVAPFKNKYLNLLDLFFLANFNLYAGTELFVLTISSERSKVIVFETGVLDIIFIGSAMIVGTCILIYHIVFASGCFRKCSEIYKEIFETEDLQKMMTTEVAVSDDDFIDSNEPILELQNQSPPSSFHRLRESLLDDQL